MTMKLLWDFDGTLADAPTLWSRAIKSVGKEYGIGEIDYVRLVAAADDGRKGVRIVKLRELERILS